MLNAQDIAKRIGNPSLSQKEDQNDLKQLAEKYPYSQLFSILYLKSLKQSRDVLFEEELKAHSYRISDRIQLYHLIHEEDREEEVEHEKIISEVPIEEAETPDAVEEPEIAEEVILSETTFVESNDTSEVDVSDDNEIEVHEEVSETKESTEKEVEEPEISSVNEPISEEVPIEEESSSLPTEEEINSENSESPQVEAQYYFIQEEINPTSEELSQDQLEETILHNVYAANYRLEDLSEEEQKKLEARIEVPQKPEKDEERTATPEINEPKKSFTSWLHANENFVEPTNDETEEIKAIVTNFKEFDPTQELFGEIKKPKKEFFSATKKGKKSLAEEGLPVSETLAKIYEMQGNYPKAISAYEQLSLINPEKRTFFASLIEKLKKKLNSE